jgi:divalent metal cation (Fe/Co/Zn/Cd) transporter
MAKSESNPSRIENILAFMAAGVIGASLLTMLIALLSRLFNVNPWPILTQIPLIGLPFGFVIILVLLFVSMRRRSRENK